MTTQTVSSDAARSKPQAVSVELPPLSAVALGFNVDKLLNVVASNAIKQLKENTSPQSIEAAKTLAIFGLKLLPDVLALVDRPTSQERLAVSAKHSEAVRAARDAGQADPEPPEIVGMKVLRAEHLREYLTLLGPGIDIAKPLIEKAMLDGSAQATTPSQRIRYAAYFASWARAYANASGGGKDILPELRSYQALVKDAKSWSFGGADPKSAAEFIDTLIEEVESGEIKPIYQYMFIGQS